MSGIWVTEYSEPDCCWQVKTQSGMIYKSCQRWEQAVDIMARCPTEPDAWDHFCHWKRTAGERLVEWARQKLVQKRRREG